MLISPVAEARAALPRAVAEGEEGEHEVEYAPNGDPVLSPSQRKTFATCPRRWAGKYIWGMADPTGQGAIDGKKMHKQLERYFGEHVAPDITTPWGTWAAALLAKIDHPLPGPGVVPEHKIKFEHEGVWWRGSEDLRYHDGEILIVEDYKSTSDLKWALTPERLQGDSQGVIYALAEFIADPSLQRVGELWAYVTREKHPLVQPVRVVQERDEVLRAMEPISVDGRRMLQLYKERPDINDLEPTGTATGGCNAFNKACPVTNACRLSPEERMRGLQIYNKIKENPNMASTFLEQMREKDLKKKALGGTGVIVDVNALVRDGIKAALDAAPVPQVAEPPAPVTSTTPPAQTMREKLAAEAVAEATPAPAKTDLNPPPFTPPVKADDLQEKLEASVAAPSPPATPSRGVGRKGVKKPVAPEAVPVPSGPTPQEVVKSVAASTDALLKEAMEAMQSSPIIVKDTPELRVAINNDDGKVVAGMTLYVNCAPLDHATQYVLFSHYVHSVHEQVSSAHALPVYQLGQFEGKAHFVNYVKQLLADQPQAAIVVDSRTDEGRDALPWLERAAARIVRGF